MVAAAAAAGGPRAALAKKHQMVGPEELAQWAAKVDLKKKAWPSRKDLAVLAPTVALGTKTKTLSWVAVPPVPAC